MKTAETIRLYTLDEAEKIIDYRRRKEARKRRKELKQKLAFKCFALLVIIINIIALSVVDFDNGGCLIGIIIGLISLVIPFNMELTW